MLNIHWSTADKNQANMWLTKLAQVTLLLLLADCGAATAATPSLAAHIGALNNDVSIQLQCVESQKGMLIRPPHPFFSSKANQHGVAHSTTLRVRC